MCVAGLHVSTQPCAHRWHQLIRACQPTNNLQNCPDKLKLEGWESRTSSCPWCDIDAVLTHESTHRLLGGSSSSNSVPSSPIISDLGYNTPQRVDSFGTVSSLSPLSRQSSAHSTESDRGQRHREMNERLYTYLNSHPHEVLPSAAKNYPTYPQRQAVDAQERTATDLPTFRRYSVALPRQWRRRFRSSLNLVRT